MPTVGYQISVKMLYPLAAALRDEGIVLDPLLASAEIPRELYERSESRIPYLAVRRFYHAAAATSRNRALGLAAARHVPVAQLQMLEYFAASSANVGAALQALVEYESVLTGVPVLSLEPRSEGVLLRVQPVTAGAHRSWFEFVVGSLYLGMRRFASPPVVRGERVIAWFAYTAHDADDDYRALFDGRVRFGAPATGLLIPRSIMHRSLESVNAPLHDLLERSLSAIAQRESPPSSFSDRVRTLLGESLADADAGIDAIAARLHMSRSTLRRRLAHEGTTHRALLQEVREALALRYLERQELSLGEVSDLVGYDDPTSFQKAFKRWMGCTPAQHRARVHHDAVRRTSR
jgi:AraC-like DNA-binding protein